MNRRMTLQTEAEIEVVAPAVFDFKGERINAEKAKVRVTATLDVTMNGVLLSDVFEAKVIQLSDGRVDVVAVGKGGAGVTATVHSRTLVPVRSMPPSSRLDEGPCASV